MTDHQIPKRRKTAREIAEKVGLSIRTVQRHISRPRAEYLANSITKAEPWVAMGISRATWYRRGKPAAPGPEETKVQEVA